MQLQKLSEKIGEKQGQSFFERLGRSYRFDPETGGMESVECEIRLRPFDQRHYGISCK